MGSFSRSDEEIVDQELYEAFLTALEARLRSAAVPECKWRTLCYKLTHTVFDAGQDFMYLKEDDSADESQRGLSVYTKCQMSPSDANHIYLIDHAWTYTLNTARKTLEENAALVERLTALFEIDSTDVLDVGLIGLILKKIWLFNDCYSLKKDNEIVDCWFVLDEFGSKIRHSEDPTFEMVTFFYVGDNSMYSVLFPRVDVCEEDEVTVSYPNCQNIQSECLRRCLTYPWNPSDLTDIDFSLSEPTVEYFASGRSEETLPAASTLATRLNNASTAPLNVFSEYSDVIQFLVHPSFNIVNDIKDANIFWLSTRQYHIKELYKTYPNLAFISQFPSEHVLINKDLLAAVCRRSAVAAFDHCSLDSYPDWLPTTFNLSTELPEFLSYYQQRRNRNLDNVWICKPFNLARGLGICVTDDLVQIIRFSQVRPMVACKYLTDPVLFPMPEKGLVKMDLRYIVLLRSTKPLELFVYERFWLRFALKAFTLENFDDYETHFTVMNYTNLPIQQMFCHDFIQKFEEYYSSYKWSDIQEKINKMITDIFVAATSKTPPSGVGDFAGSRAIYGLDIMLEWDRTNEVPDMKPVILEVNWMPDCKRACQYYPEFYNDVFSVLFLGDTQDKHVVKLQVVK